MCEKYGKVTEQQHTNNLSCTLWMKTDLHHPKILCHYLKTAPFICTASFSAPAAVYETAYILPPQRHFRPQCLFCQRLSTLPVSLSFSRCLDLNLFCSISRLLRGSLNSPRRNVSACHFGSLSESVIHAYAAGALGQHNHKHSIMYLTNCVSAQAEDNAETVTG